MNQVKQAVKIAISAVAEVLDCQTTWMNDDCRVFTGGHQGRQALFAAALQQNDVIWSSKHLIIYAGEWRWALRLKLRRIAGTRGQTDVDDAVCILKMLNTRYGPLSKRYIAS